MTSGLWVAVAGISVCAGVARGIAHLKRKQMRQIELHRRDPSVPLTPPRHPITIWLIQYGPALASIAWNIRYLYKDLTTTTAMTRGDVLNISMEVASIACLIGFIVFIFMLDKITRILTKIIDIL